MQKMKFQNLWDLRHPSIAPFEAFKTKDSHIIIAAGNDKLFEKIM